MNQRERAVIDRAAGPELGGGLGMTGQEVVARLHALVEARRYLAARTFAERHAVAALGDLEHDESVAVADLLTLVATAAEAMEGLGQADPAPDQVGLPLPPLPAIVR
jgi:hypothetical protein